MCWLEAWSVLIARPVFKAAGFLTATMISHRRFCALFCNLALAVKSDRAIDVLERAC